MPARRLRAEDLFSLFSPYILFFGQQKLCCLCWLHYSKTWIIWQAMFCCAQCLCGFEGSLYFRSFFCVKTVNTHCIIKDDVL